MAKSADFPRKTSPPVRLSYKKSISEPAVSPAVRSIHLSKYRRLARKHWAKLPLALFARLTKVRLQVGWISITTQTTAKRDINSAVSRHIIIKDIIVGIAFLRVPERRETGRQKQRRVILDRSRFGDAATLLRLFISHVEIASDLELAKGHLIEERLRATEHEHEETRLRQKLGRVLSGIRPAPAVPEHETHSEQFVRRVLDIIHESYAQPLGLKECAGKLGLNPAYLCALFSRIVGIPFKTYLTELRLEKAKRLLGDPRNRVSDVAYAVGYTDANRFRLAFKGATGLPPANWRSTLQVR
jgi:AraC-like DNA-binding protein